MVAEDGAHEDFAGVAVTERKAGVRDQVRVAIRAAEQAGAGVVGKPLLRALPGGLERQGWGGAGLVLRGAGKLLSLRHRSVARCDNRVGIEHKLNGELQSPSGRSGHSFSADEALQDTTDCMSHVPVGHRTFLRRLSRAFSSFFSRLANCLLSLHGVKPATSAKAASTWPKVMAAASAAAAMAPTAGLCCCALHDTAGRATRTALAVGAFRDWPLITREFSGDVIIAAMSSNACNQTCSQADLSQDRRFTDKRA